MKTTTNPFTQSIKSPACFLKRNTGAIAITTSDSADPVVTAGLVQLTVAGAEGSIVKSIRACSTDTASQYLQLWYEPSGGGKYLLGSIQVPASAGSTGAVAAIDVLPNASPMTGFPFDQTSKGILMLEPLAKLYVGTITQLTAGKYIHVTAAQEDF